MAWTEERVELLAKLWAEGLSASQIAAVLGGVTRNAVIGKVHRLGLSGRVKTANAAPRARKTSAPVGAGRKQTQRAPAVAAPPLSAGANALAYTPQESALPQAKPEQDVVIPISRRLTVLNLMQHTCRWPIGDPGDKDFYFCGNKCGAEESYCKHHARIAYQAPNNRRRRA